MNVMNTEVWEPLGWVGLIILFGPAELGVMLASRKLHGATQSKGDRGRRKDREEREERAKPKDR